MELPLTPWLPAPKPQLVEGFLRKIIGQILTEDLHVLGLHLLHTFLYKVIIRLGRVGGTLISLEFSHINRILLTLKSWSATTLTEIPD